MSRILATVAILGIVSVPVLLLAAIWTSDLRYFLTAMVVGVTAAALGWVGILLSDNR